MRKWIVKKGEKCTTSKSVIPSFQIMRAGCMNNVILYQTMHNRKFTSYDLSSKTRRRKGNMSLKFSHQNICNRIQIENYLFLPQNNAETWVCPWNWERWILLGGMKCFSPALQYRLQNVLQSRTVTVLKIFQYVSQNVTFKEQVS